MANQFTEIHPPISRVEKRCFAPVALKFDIADFHIEVKHPRNSACFYHHVAFGCPHFVEFFEVARIRPTNDIEKKSRIFDAFFLQLHLHEVAHERYFTHIETATAWHFRQHPVTRRGAAIRWIVEKLLP